MKCNIKLVIAISLFFILTVLMVIVQFQAQSAELGGLLGLATIIDFIWVIVIIVKTGNAESETLMKQWDEYLSSNHIKIDKQYYFAAQRYIFSFDENLLTIANFGTSNFPTDGVRTVHLNALSDVEILQDNIIIQKGGFGGALVGGAIGGVTGAVIGSNLRNNEAQCSMLAIRLLFNDKMNPIFIINLIQSPVDKSKPEYANAFSVVQELYATFVAILNENQAKHA